MVLESLWVQGFRVLAEQRLDIAAPIVAVEGGNGAGKSTLLDAVYFLASGNPAWVQQRRPNPGGENYFVVGGAYRSADPVAGASVRHTAQAMFTREGHKEVRIDGSVYHAFVHLIGGLRVVQFNFNSVFLVKGMPSVRRQFLNSLIASSDHGYLETLSAYASVVTHKNALLRQSSTGPIDGSLLDVF